MRTREDAVALPLEDVVRILPLGKKDAVRLQAVRAAAHDRDVEDVTRAILAGNTQRQESASDSGHNARLARAPESLERDLREAHAAVVDLLLRLREANGRIGRLRAVVVAVAGQGSADEVGAALTGLEPADLCNVTRRGDDRRTG
jgi:plasmid stability protein